MTANNALRDTSDVEEQEIDYRRKRGMLEEINQRVQAMEKDEAALRKLREREAKDEAQAIEITN